MSGEQGVNIPLLRKAVEWVEQQAALPKRQCEWNQGTWRDETSCGTTYCVAGFVCAVEDREPTWVGDTPFVAADLLGLKNRDWGEQGHLFHPENAAEDVRRIAEDLAGERL